MNLLDRHIFKHVLLTCAAAIGLFSFVVALPNVIKDLLGPLLAGQISLEMFLRLIVMLLPFAFTFALPMGILTGVLLTLGRLSADSEITAMRSAGLSVGRIARPVFLVGVLCAIAALYLNFEAMPRARVSFHRELQAAMRSNPLSFIVPKTFIRDFKGVVIYVGERNGTLLRDVWVWRLDNEMRVTTIERSETGRIDYNEASDSIAVTLTPAQIESRNKDNPEDFSRAPIVNLFGLARPEPIEASRYLGRRGSTIKSEWLTYSQLRERQATQAQLPLAAGADPKEREREAMKISLVLHEKFNFALAVFSFALIGVPLGIKVSRRETSANLGLALLLVICYYFLTVMVKWLDRHPEYHPDLLLWMPNLIFIALGVWLFRRIEQ